MDVVVRKQRLRATGVNLARITCMPQTFILQKALRHLLSTFTISTRYTLIRSSIVRVITRRAEGHLSRSGSNFIKEDVQDTSLKLAFREKSCHRSHWREFSRWTRQWPKILVFQCLGIGLLAREVIFIRMLSLNEVSILEWPLETVRKMLM